MTLELLENDIHSTPGEDDVRPFLREIRQIPMLTPREEQLLAQRCAQGDEEAIRHMVNANLRLVVSVAREYAGRGVPLLDLIQEGSIGLLVAARKFDHTLDFRFSTYATKWIRQGINRYLQTQGNLIRVPQYSGDRMRKIEQARHAFRQETGREPTDGEIAARCGIPEEKVRKFRQLMPEVCSLDAPVGEEDTLGMLLKDARAPEPQEALIRRELEHTLTGLLGMLSERQQKILQMHFGMSDGVCYSLEEISTMLGISKERVRQVEKQAMEKLRVLGADVGLEDFLE